MGESSCDKRRKQHICAGTGAGGGLESLVLIQTCNGVFCTVLEANKALELKTRLLSPLLFIDKYQELPKGFPDSFLSEGF